MKFLKLINLTALTILIVSCNSGKSNKEDKKSSPEVNDNQLSGRVVFLKNWFISPVYAQISSVCDSTCTEVDQSRCVVLSVIRTDSTEEIICKKNLLSNDNYVFNILNKSYLVHKVLKIYISNFKGSNRELTTAMNENGLERRHNISDRSTVNSGPILADLLRRKALQEEIGDSIENLVTDVASSAAGAIHNCVLFGSGKVKCWGNNQVGVLGLGDKDDRGNISANMGVNLPFLDFGSNRNVMQLSVGTFHSCVVLDNGDVKCWGYNGETGPEEESGALGIGDTNSRGDDPSEMGDNLSSVNLGADLKVKKIYIGFAFSCALLTNDKVKCWGGNAYGKLGQGFENGSYGNQPGEMGDNLPYLDFGAGRTVKDITNGFNNACAILDNNELKCWGYYGRSLGLGHIHIIGNNPGEMGDNLPAVDLGSNRYAKQISLGFRFSCALLDNNLVKCWGENDYGNLGLGDTTQRGGGPGEMGDALPYVDLGSGRTAKKIALSYNSACALLDNNKVKCWGSNYLGALGQGHTFNLGDQPGEMGDELPYVDLGNGRTVVDLVGGSGHLCAVLDNLKMKCWGQNNQYQLGLGHNNSMGDQPGEMGDALPYVNLTE
jgi:alpha-tubulin suppressor-like RCC1 family protein